MKALRDFGRRPTFQAVGAPAASPPVAPLPPATAPAGLPWCYEGTSLPCLCVHEKGGLSPEGCTEAPACDDTQSNAPCLPTTGQKVKQAVRLFGPIVGTGAIVGGAIGYGMKKNAPGTLIGASIGAVTAPVALAGMALLALGAVSSSGAKNW